MSALGPACPGATLVPGAQQVRGGGADGHPFVGSLSELGAGRGAGPADSGEGMRSWSGGPGSPGRPPGGGVPGEELLRARQALCLPDISGEDSCLAGAGAV